MKKVYAAATTARGRRIVPLRLAPGKSILPFDGHDPSVAEQYRMIRTALLNHPAQPRVVAVTSANKGDGKTITSVNLSAAVAVQNGGDVLLIDADMRSSRLGGLLGIETEPGLAEVLRGACPPEEAIVSVKQFPSLHVLPCGSRAASPAELLDSEAWRELLLSARERFRLTIIDTSPVATVADFGLVQLASDGVVLVARPDHTERADFFDALRAVPKEKMLGVLLNGVKDWFLWRRYRRG